MSRLELDAGSWNQLQDVIRRSTRLRVTNSSRDLLRRLVERRLAELELTPEAYVERLKAGTPQTGELERVVRELTVGETYFFRGHQLAEIRSELLPELIERRRREPPRHLRILSAGCATGEEPYTLVMILSELLDDFDEWYITVRGLDLNTGFLRAAEAAAYSDWSLRDVPQATIDRHFERKGGRYHVLPALRSRVRFSFVNLALDPLPAPALGVMALDLILCQNVLYHFEPDARQAVAEKLARCLAPDGYLVFGPADLLSASVPRCQTRSFGEMIAYQRKVRITVPPPPSSRQSLPIRPASLPAPSDPSLPAPDHPEPGADDESPLSVTLEQAQALADDGDLPGALVSVEAFLAQNPESADAHTLHGFLLAEIGSPDRALAAFRRATYLQEGLLLAHAGAAMAAQRLGQRDLAKRARARVRKLADALPPTTLVRGWEGMTTGRLLRLFDDQTEELLR